jgi:hypothetical protein
MNFSLIQALFTQFPQILKISTKEGIGHDNSSSTVFDFKTVSTTGQIGRQETIQKLKILSLTKPQQDNSFSQVQTV